MARATTNYQATPTPKGDFGGDPENPLMAMMRGLMALLLPGPSPTGTGGQSTIPMDPMDPMQVNMSMQHQPAAPPAPPQLSPPGYTNQSIQGQDVTGQGPPGVGQLLAQLAPETQSTIPPPPVPQKKTPAKAPPIPAKKGK